MVTVARTQIDYRSSKWLRAAQIAIGAACIILAILIAFSPALGAYAFLALASAALMVLGAERVAAGLRSKHERMSSRLINVAIGAGLIAWMGSAFFLPQFAVKYFVLILGVGFLANGAVMVVSGLRHSRMDSGKISPLTSGVVCLSIALVVLLFPTVGLGLLIVLTSVALAISGIQVVILGLRGRQLAAQVTEIRRHTYSPLENKRVLASGVWKDGSWFRDEQGRYLLFRGVNFGSRSKLPPYLPIAPLGVTDLARLDIDKEIASVREELDHLRDFGFNVVRLLISWKAIEPRPNPNLAELLPEGQLYLRYVKKIINELYSRNLLVILDFHQDIAHEAYGGDGFPDWALAIDQEHKRPEHTIPTDKKWAIKYALNKSVKQTLRSFWKDDLTNTDMHMEHFPVRTHLEKTIGQVDRFFQTLNNGLADPAILGIEPFNEPHPVGFEKEEFEKDVLFPFYKNVNSELARYGSDTFLFIEPRVDWTGPRSDESKSVLGPAPFSVRGAFHMDLVKNAVIEGKIDAKQIRTYLPIDMSSAPEIEQNGVLSFHYYDPMAVASSFLKIPESMYTYRREWPAIFDQLASSAKERDLVPFLTEFGGFQGAEQAREYLNLLFEQIESHLLNSTYWNYDLYNTEEGKDNWNLEDYSLLGPHRTLRNIDVVCRPYPVRSSAEPTLLFFDVQSKYATVVLKGPSVDAPTIIYVPFNLHYIPEFNVWATGRDVMWDRELQLLSWYPSKRLQVNQLIIGKSKSLDLDALPKQARTLQDSIKFLGSFA